MKSIENLSLHWFSAWTLDMALMPYMHPFTQLFRLRAAKLAILKPSAPQSVNGLSINFF
jgi:hypothetical protein